MLNHDFTNNFELSNRLYEYCLIVVYSNVAQANRDGIETRTVYAVSRQITYFSLTWIVMYM